MALVPSPRRAASLAGLALVLLGTLALIVSRAHSIASGSAPDRPPAVLHWANEGISDLYTLDPDRGPDFNARQAIQLIYGGLVRFGPGFRILPDAAGQWRVSSGGRTYTFTLRPNLRFGDGTRLTADDVAFSLNRALSRQFASTSGAYLLNGIVGAAAVADGRVSTASGIQVVNARVVRIRLQSADGSFLAKLANPAGYILPRNRILANPASWDQHAVGTGPFMVARWIHQNGLLLIPNPYYYGGPVRLSGIDMPFIPEPLTAYKRYSAGALDLMGTIHFPTDALFDVEGHADFHRSPRLETVYLTLNERRAPFGNLWVRQALAHAVNREAIVEAAYDSFAHPAFGMMPPGLPGYNPHVSGEQYDPALARRLLARAGYPGGKGLPVIVYPVDQDAQSLVLANVLAQQWRRILGVRVRPVQYTHSAYLTLLQRLKYQIAVIDWTADYPDPENFLSQQLRTGSPNNNGNWSSRAFDRLVDRADRMPPTAPARFAMYRAAEEIAMHSAATIPLVNPTAGILLRTDVHGLQISGGYVLVRDWTRVSVSPGVR